jgi:hypothetical protein
MDSVENNTELYNCDKEILSLNPGWIFVESVMEGWVNRLSNLYGLYHLGATLQKLSDLLKGHEAYSKIALAVTDAMRNIQNIISGHVLPLVAVQESAKELFALMAPLTTGQFMKENWKEPLNVYYSGPIEESITAFQFALSEELRQLPVYVVTEKGNLSHIKLIDGASKGYPTQTTELFDDFIRFEIDESGRCLAFGLFTACGYHILRAVEVAVKGYIYATTGALPPIPKRSWGEYIKCLQNSNAPTDLLELITILKTMRNPLMHPQDILKEEDAINIFSICRAVMDRLVSEIYDKKLDAHFGAALAIMPNL